MTDTAGPPIPLSAYRLIDEDAAKKAYDAFAGPRGKRSTKEKMRDALAAYETARANPSPDLGLIDKLEAELRGLVPGIEIFGFGAPRVHNTSMFALAGASSETQLIALDLAGICVSNGSACSSGTVKPSAVLRAMGVAPALADCALRVSLGWGSTARDIDRFLEAWGGFYQRIRPRLAARGG